MRWFDEPPHLTPAVGCLDQQSDGSVWVGSRIREPNHAMYGFVEAGVHNKKVVAVRIDCRPVRSPDDASDKLWPFRGCQRFRCEVPVSYGPLTVARNAEGRFQDVPVRL